MSLNLHLIFFSLVGFTVFIHSSIYTLRAPMVGQSIMFHFTSSPWFDCLLPFLLIGLKVDNQLLGHRLKEKEREERKHTTRFWHRAIYNH